MKKTHITTSVLLNTILTFQIVCGVFLFVLPPVQAYAATDNKPSWTRLRSNPVIPLGKGSAWDSGRILEPTVVKVGSVYYLYYSGNTNNKAGEEVGWHLGLATSTDGIHWTKYGKNPIIRNRWEASVTYVNNTFYLYAASSPGSGNAYLYTSKDGINWISRGSVFSKTSAREFEIYYESGTWYLYFAYVNGGKYKIGCATSANGTSFKQYRSNPLVSTSASWESGGDIEDPAVFKLWDGARYKYALSYIGFTPGNPKPWKNGFAFSNNLTSGWTKSSLNPHLSPSSKSWENYRTGEAAFILVGDNVFMYYSGGNSVTNQIGLATMLQSSFESFFK